MSLHSLQLIFQFYHKPTFELFKTTTIGNNYSAAHIPMVSQDEEDKDTDIDPTLALRYWLRSRAKHLINSIKMKDKLFPPEVNLIESYQRCSYKLGASNEKFQMSEVYQYYSFTPIIFRSIIDPDTGKSFE